MQAWRGPDLRGFIRRRGWAQRTRQRWLFEDAVCRRAGFGGRSRADRAATDGLLLKCCRLLADYYRMSSAHVSGPVVVNAPAMRAAAAVHDDHAAAFEDFRARCQGWLETVEEDIVGCQGPVAAPVAAALAAFG